MDAKSIYSVLAWWPLDYDSDELDLIQGIFVDRWEAFEQGDENAMEKFLYELFVVTTDWDKARGKETFH